MRKSLFLYLILVLGIIAGCNKTPSESVLLYQENNEITGEEREELVSEISPTIYESIDRSNEEAEEILISPIERPGESVTPPPGRYKLHIGEMYAPQSGRVYVYDEDEKPLLEETIGVFGISEVNVSLNGSHTVYVNGLLKLQISPVDTEPSNILTAGIWEVGKDIPPGTYSVFNEGYGIGDLYIFENGKEPRVFEVIDHPTKDPIEVELMENQIIKISGLDALGFYKPGTRPRESNVAW